jgi:hypothetical protein
VKAEHQVHDNALAALTERMRIETAEPLELKIATLQDALDHALVDN